MTAHQGTAHRLCQLIEGGVVPGMVVPPCTILIQRLKIESHRRAIGRTPEGGGRPSTSRQLLHRLSSGNPQEVGIS